jgi:hypothetical protein
MGEDSEDVNINIDVQRDLRRHQISCIDGFALTPAFIDMAQWFVTQSGSDAISRQRSIIIEDAEQELMVC